MSKVKCRCGEEFEINAMFTHKGLELKKDIKNIIIVFECPKCKIPSNIVWCYDAKGELRTILLQGVEVKQVDKPYYMG